MARFIGAADESEVVFTKNVSEAINLVAYSIGNAVSGAPPAGRGRRGRHQRDGASLQHRALAVALPADRCQAPLVRGDPEGRLDTSTAGDLINERTKILAISHQSNVLGTINPVADLAARAHAVGAVVLVDAAQSVPHGLMDVSSLGADFVGFTGHKMCGPTGIGVLWGRRELLEELPPFLGGGEMIETVWMDHSTYAPPPHKFEAGTMPIAQAVGLGAAIDYLSEVDLAAVRAHEHALVSRALEELGEIDGPADTRAHRAGRSRQRDLVHGWGRAPARCQPGARRLR